MRHFLLSLIVLVSLLAPTAVWAEDEATPAPAPAPEEATEDERARTKQLVADLRAITSEIRGLAWKKEVPAELLTRTQVRKRLTAQIKKELPPEELEKMTRIIHRMGLLPKDTDPLKLALDMITSMAGGFFDPEEDRLFLIAGQDPQTLKPVIVHELLHALEDQYIDLKARQEEFKKDPDRMFAFKCLLEGSAEQCRMLYEARDPAAALAFAEGMQTNTEAMAGQRKTLATVPAFLMIDTLLHYRTGPDFVGKALQGDYKGGMDALYANGPTTQEQVLHPERWLTDNKDLPRRVVWADKFTATLEDGWSELEDMSQGELDLAILLDFYLGPDDGKLSPGDMAAGRYVTAEARTAAEGWDAGRITYFDRHGEHIGLVGAWAFDTVKDREEATKALHAMIKTMSKDDYAVHPSRHEAFGPRVFIRGSEMVGVLHYTNEHGMGMVISRGDHLIWADGFTLEELVRIAPLLSGTRFERQPGDTWNADDAPDPLEGCDVVDRGRGLGVALPNESWTENLQARTLMRAQDPAFFAAVASGDTRIMLRAMDNGASKAVLPMLIQQVLKQAGAPYDASKIVDATIGGHPGVGYDVMPAGAPNVVQFRLASDGLRMFMAIIQSTSEDFAKKEADVDTMLGSLRSILGY
jgi:hypothetical protein